MPLVGDLADRIRRQSLLSEVDPLASVAPDIRRRNPLIAEVGFFVNALVFVHNIHMRQQHRYILATQRGHDQTTRDRPSMKNPYNTIDKIPGKNLLFVGFMVIITIVLFELWVQPILVEISPMFSDGYGSNDLGGRRPDTPAGVVMVVMLSPLSYGYLRIKHIFVEPYLKKK